jgi:phthalate 4,5-cis-dihydrodiol dehydrogenase
MAATTKVVRVGFAGLGVASTQVLPAFALLPHMKAAAAADVRTEALDKFTEDFGGEAFHSVEDMVKSPNVDVVFVSTPNHFHAEHVIIAAEHKKNVIVEKPMALTVAECQSMVDAAKRNGVRLMQGHTKMAEAPVRRMGEIVRSGELGRLGMIHTWNYTDLIYRPRMPHELVTDKGGGAVYLQAPHQVDIIRYVGGGMVRSVRGMLGDWVPSRPTDGAYTAYMEFEDGTPATAVYNGYSHFDSAELHFWVGEGGMPRDPETNVKARREIQQAEVDGNEEQLKSAMRYAGRSEGAYSHFDAESRRRQPFFGITIASCEKGDIRQSADGLLIYGDEGIREISLGDEPRGRVAELNEMYNAIMEDRDVFPSGEWGMATLEVTVAIIESARQRKELYLSHQSPVKA